MTSYVVDASALLAAIHNEVGGDYVQRRIHDCVISGVNWSEVLQKLERAGADTEKVEQGLKALGLVVVDFIEEDARLAAAFGPMTKDLGLSLADRACLALGKRLRAVVITADWVWGSVDLGVEVELIR